MLKKIDQLVNSITMYRLVLYGLLALAVTAVLGSYLGLIVYTPLQIFASLILLSGLCQLTNFILAKIFSCQTNTESATITSLILFFLFAPFNGLGELITLVIAATVAIASKFVLTNRHAHFFNPAAIAAVLLPLFGFDPALWWMATPFLLPLTIIVGGLVIYKTKKVHLAGAFLLASSLTILYTNWNFFTNPLAFATELLLSWPIVFFVGIMLTEPLTMPPTKKLQIVYGILVGLLFGLPFHFGPLYASPELALLFGNLFALVVSQRKTLLLTLKYKEQLADNIYEFNFHSFEKLEFKPGQYLEWTLAPNAADSRGNRRFFTIASSPTEKLVKVGVKVPSQASSFKQELLKLEPGQKIFAASLAGDFTLPENKLEKIVMIAGGIGITPFRSMIKYLLDKAEQRDVILIYSASRQEELVYQDLWKEATKIGLRTILLCGSNETSPKKTAFKTGRISKKLIEQEIPDWHERIFYLSGPSALVNDYKNLLRKMRVKKIVTDYFPGF